MQPPVIFDTFLPSSLPTASLAQNYSSSRISRSRYQLRRGACGQHSGPRPPTHPCYKSSASILNRQEATSTLPGSSLCGMSMEDDLQEAIIFDSAKIKGEFWIRRRELVGIQIASWQSPLGPEVLSAAKMNVCLTVYLFGSSKVLFPWAKRRKGFWDHQVTLDLETWQRARHLCPCHLTATRSLETLLEACFAEA